MIISNVTVKSSSKKGLSIDWVFVVTASRLPDNCLVCVTMFMIITVIMALVEAMATSPKLSFSDALLSFFSEETPNASDKIKGTVNAPVVAPDESKEMARNYGDVKIASTKMMTYNISNNLYSGKL